MAELAHVAVPMVFQTFVCIVAIVFGLQPANAADHVLVLVNDIMWLEYYDALIAVLLLCLFSSLCTWLLTCCHLQMLR